MAEALNQRLYADLPIDCSLPFLFVTILYWMGGLQFAAGAFFATLFSVLLLVLVAQSFGLLIGAIVPVPKTAQTITTVVALSMVSCPPPSSANPATIFPVPSL
jgi:ATP-binding cassette subfamily G (WHITE) protein 2